MPNAKTCAMVINNLIARHSEDPHSNVAVFVTREFTPSSVPLWKGPILHRGLYFWVRDGKNVSMAFSKSANDNLSLYLAFRATDQPEELELEKGKICTKGYRMDQHKNRLKIRTMSCCTVLNGAELNISWLSEISPRNLEYRVLDCAHVWTLHWLRCVVVQKMIWQKYSNESKEDTVKVGIFTQKL